MYYLKSELRDRIEFEKFQQRAAWDAIGSMNPIDIIKTSPEAFADEQWALYQDEILANVDDADEAAASFRNEFISEFADAKNWNLGRVVSNSRGQRFYIGSDDSLIQLAIESGLFEVRKNQGRGWALSWNDAPFALCRSDHDYLPELWGLGEEMDIEDALEDYEHLEDHVAEICKKVSVSCEEVV